MKLLTYCINGKHSSRSWLVN